MGSGCNASREKPRSQPCPEAELEDGVQGGSNDEQGGFRQEEQPQHPVQVGLEEINGQGQAEMHGREHSTCKTGHKDKHRQGYVYAAHGGS